jgi:hypothetical protein
MLHPKNGQTYPYLGHLIQLYLENRLSIKGEILRGILKKIVLELDVINSYKNAQEVDVHFYAKKRAENTHFLPL